MPVRFHFEQRWQFPHRVVALLFAQLLNLLHVLDATLLVVLICGV